MVIKNKLTFGDRMYVINDPEQKEFILVGLHITPGAIAYELSYLGEVIEVYDFEVSENRDVLKSLLNDKTEES